MPRDAHNRFISEGQAEVERIGAELAEAEQRLPELERQLTDAVATCAPSGDFRPAQDIGRQVQMTRDTIAKLQADLAAAETTEDRRRREITEREERARVRNLRARLGELNTAATEIDATFDRVRRWYAKGEAALSAVIDLLLPGDAVADNWPLRLTRCLEDAVDEAGKSVLFDDPTSVAVTVAPSTEFLRARIKELAGATIPTTGAADDGPDQSAVAADPSPAGTVDEGERLPLAAATADPATDEFIEM